MKTIAKLAIISLLLVSCSTSDAYVAADRATYQTIGAEYRAYVESDQTMQTPEKQRRIRTLEAWRLRLEKAEGK